MTDPRFTYADPSMPPVKRGLIRAVEAATGQRQLRRMYLDHRRQERHASEFWAASVRGLALDVRYDAAALDAIPRSGPCVVVANHPYGVLDGIVLSWLVQKMRPDFMVLTHAALLAAPETHPYLLPVDFSGTPEAREVNLRSRDVARQRLEAGGCIVVFPAGAISTAPDRLGRERAVDGPWQPFTAQLVQRSRATVVPVCFGGQNSRLFQIASHVSASLRLALIFHEVASRIGSTLHVAIGAPIPWQDLARLEGRHAIIDDLRARTYALAERLPPISRQPGLRIPVRLDGGRRPIRIGRLRLPSPEMPEILHKLPRRTKTS